MQVYRDTLRQELSLMVGFIASVTLFVAMIIFIYPGDEAAVEQLTGLTEMGDWEAAFGIMYGEGAEYRFWLALLLFSYVGILYTAIPALAGTNVIARDSEKKTLDLLLGTPTSRRSLLLQKILAVLTISAVSVLFMFLLVLGLSEIIGQHIKIEILGAACLQIFTLQIGIAVLSIFLAVIFRDLGKARTYIAVILMGSFIISMIVLFSEELEFLKYIQVFYYYDSAQTLLKPTWNAVNWDKSLYLMIFSVIVLVATMIINDRKDLLPHYSHDPVVRKSRSRGIPIPFFYTRIWQNKYPAFVEQLQADRLIFYIFALIVVTSGLITPVMYPGDEAWVGLSKTYDSVLLGGALHQHGVAQTFIGYIATEGLGEFFMYMGIAAMVLGSKIVLRDIRTNTADMLIAQPVAMSQVLKQRMAAVALEMLTIFALSWISYTLSILGSGYGEEYIFIIGVGLLSTCVVCLFMTYVITLVMVVLRTNRGATGIAGLIYYGTLLIFMVGWSVDQLRILSKLTPFYWLDRTGMLYSISVGIEDLAIFGGYIVAMLAMAYASLRLFRTWEFYG